MTHKYGDEPTYDGSERVCEALEATVAKTGVSDEGLFVFELCFDGHHLVVCMDRLNAGRLRDSLEFCWPQLFDPDAPTN
jgi:hypothetical protein